MLDRRAIDHCRDQLLPLLNEDTLAGHWRNAVRSIRAQRSAYQELQRVAQDMIEASHRPGANFLELISECALTGRGDQDDYDLHESFVFHYGLIRPAIRWWNIFPRAGRRQAAIARAVGSLCAIAYLELYESDSFEFPTDIRPSAMAVPYLYKSDGGAAHDLAVAYPLFYLERCLSSLSVLDEEASSDLVMSLVFAAAAAREASAVKRVAADGAGVRVGWDRLEETLCELLCRLVVPHQTFRSVLDRSESSVDWWVEVASMGRLPAGEITSWVCASSKDTGH